MVEAYDGVLRLDGIVIKRASGAYRSLRWLIARHAEDVVAEKAPDAHCWWSARELAEELSTDGTVTRAAVKRGLARLITEMNKVYREATGLELGSNAVLESSRSGYRLNPAVYGRLA